MQLFKELKVVELASVLAGPSVGMFFAEMGAEVVKIENAKTGGDVTRQWRLPTEDPDTIQSAYYSSVNWNKRSLFLDLSQANDREEVYKLVQEADVVIANFKSGDDVKLGMDAATLRALNDRLIYAKIIAFEEDSERVAFDVVLQAESGFLYMTGERPGAFVKMPVALIDLVTAHQLKTGIVSALWQRERTGKGAEVSASLMESAIASLANQSTNWLMAGHIPQPMGTRHPNIAPYGEVFYTADEKPLVLAVGNDKQFAKLCSILGVDELLTDERFKKNADRVKNRAALNALLKPLFDKFSEREQLLQTFEKAKVPAGAIRDMREVFELPIAKNMLLEETLAEGQQSLRPRTVVFKLKN